MKEKQTLQELGLCTLSFMHYSERCPAQIYTFFSSIDMTSCAFVRVTKLNMALVKHLSLSFAIETKLKHSDVHLSSQTIFDFNVGEMTLLDLYHVGKSAQIV